jgi:hypothetical protein
MPALRRATSVSTSREAGPIVPTILVIAGMEWDFCIREAFVKIELEFKFSSQLGYMVFSYGLWQCNVEVLRIRYNL